MGRGRLGVNRTGKSWGGRKWMTRLNKRSGMSGKWGDKGMREIASEMGVGAGVVQRIKLELSQT